MLSLVRMRYNHDILVKILSTLDYDISDIKGDHKRFKYI